MFQQNLGQNGQQAAHTHLLAEEDLAYTVLADLKRVSKEYATAVTESNSQVIRQMFTTLLNNTLRLQGELYTAMSQNNLYDAPTSALRQEVDKQLQKQKQSQQKANQLLQKIGLSASSTVNTQTQIQQPQLVGQQQQQFQNFQQNQFPIAASTFQSSHNQQSQQHAFQQSQQPAFQQSAIPFQSSQSNNQFQQQQQNSFKQNALHQQQHAQQNQQRNAQNSGFLPLQPIHQSPTNQSNYFS